MMEQILNNIVFQIISILGFSAIIVAISVFFALKISENGIEKKIQEVFDKKIETHKAYLDKKKYISKTRFDVEFDIYRNLTKKFFDMVKGICVLIPYGYSKVPAEKKEREKYEKENFMIAQEAVICAQDELNQNAAFIKKDIFDGFNELLGIAKYQVDVFSERWNVGYLVSEDEKKKLSIEDYKRSKKLKEKYDKLIYKIREYLESLDII